MSEGQYRALVAYLSFWSTGEWEGFSVETALKDIGITLTPEAALSSLKSCGWDWDNKTKTLQYKG